MGMRCDGELPVPSAFHPSSTSTPRMCVKFCGLQPSTFSPLRMSCDVWLTAHTTLLHTWSARSTRRMLSPPHGWAQMAPAGLTRKTEEHVASTYRGAGAKSDAAESPWTLAALSIEMKWDGKLPLIQCYPGHCPRRLWWSASYFIWAGNRVPLSPAEACVSHLIPLSLLMQQISSNLD